MIYLKLIVELMCWEFAPSCWAEVSPGANRPHSRSSMSTQNYAQKIYKSSFGHSIRLELIKCTLKQMSIMVLKTKYTEWIFRAWRRSPDIHWLTQLPEALFFEESNKGHLPPNPTFPSQSLHQHCRTLVLFFLSWAWPRSPQGWVPPLQMQVSISCGHLPGTRPPPSKMLHRFLTLFKVRSFMFLPIQSQIRTHYSVSSMRFLNQLLLWEM